MRRRFRPLFGGHERLLEIVSALYVESQRCITGREGRPPIARVTAATVRGIITTASETSRGIRSRECLFSASIGIFQHSCICVSRRQDFTFTYAQKAPRQWISSNGKR